VDDALVTPEIDAHDLDPGQIVPEIRQRRVLNMAEKMALKHVALKVGVKRPGVAGRVEDGRLGAIVESRPHGL